MGGGENHHKILGVSLLHPAPPHHKLFVAAFTRGSLAAKDKVEDRGTENFGNIPEDDS